MQSGLQGIPASSRTRRSRPWRPLTGRSPPRWSHARRLRIDLDVPSITGGFGDRALHDDIAVRDAFQVIFAASCSGRRPPQRQRGNVRGGSSQRRVPERHPSAFRFPPRSGFRVAFISQWFRDTVRCIGSEPALLHGVAEHRANLYETIAACHSCVQRGEPPCACGGRPVGRPGSCLLTFQCTKLDPLAESLVVQLAHCEAVTAITPSASASDLNLQFTSQS